MKRSWSFVVLIGVVAAVMAVRFIQDRSGGEAVYTEEGLRVELKAVQPVSPSLQTTAFQLMVSERSEDHPVTGAAVELHLSMPNMFCGVIPAEVEELQPGLYRATAVPVMPGRWQAEAVLHWKDRNVKVRAYFEVP